MNKHTSARKGKRINVILKNGDSFVDKLVEIKSRYYEFETQGKIQTGDIRSFSIHKNSDSKQATK